MGYDRGDSFTLDFLNQIEFHLVQNRKENCHHDQIPFNLKGNGNIVFSVQTAETTPNRRTFFRGNGASWHHEGRPEISQTSQHYGIEGFKRGTQLGTH